MKKTMVLISCIALAACSETGAQEEDAASMEMAEPEANYAGGPGTYTRTTDEGQTSVTVISDDGTYTSSVDGEQTSAGMTKVDGATICFDNASEGEPDACWVNEPIGEDGVFETTNPDGETYTIQMTETVVAPMAE